MIFLSPYFWVALIGIFVVGYVTGCSQERGELVKTEAAWEADKKQRLETLKRIDNERKAAVEVVQAQALERARKDKEAFDALQSRTNDIAAELRRVTVELSIVGRLRDAVNTANAETPGASGKPPQDPAAITAGTSGYALVTWFNDVARLYKECRDEVIEWNAFWDKQMAIQ